MAPSMWTAAFIRRALAPLLVAAFFYAAEPARAANYVSGIEDLPLMPGLTESIDEAAVFDQPAGRVVSAVAAGPVSPASVRAFYEETLPALGWSAPEHTKAGNMIFHRAGEYLEIEARNGGGQSTSVRFMLSPE